MQPRPAVLTATVVFTALALLGCGGPLAERRASPDPVPAGEELPVGHSDHVLDHDGVERTFRVYRPADLAEDAPLILMLHGGYGSGRHAEAAYDWDAAADRHGFVAVFPDGQGRSWNAGGGCCGPAARDDVDDVAFLSEVVRVVSAAAPIDPDRIAVTGMSNGAIMAYRLACETTLFAAVAPVAGTQLAPCPAPEPISMLQIHGAEDTRVRYDGEAGTPYSPRSDPIDGPPIPEVYEMWREVGGCGPPDVSRTAADVRSTAPCPDGRTVELHTLTDLDHTWPDGAADAIATFVAEHPRP